MVVIGVLLAVSALRLQPRASASWTEFSIGPTYGESSSIQPTTIRSSGITLRGALAIAYDMPAVRVIGPPWLADTRYAMTAVVRADAADSFRSILREELNNRLSVETHFEMRPFDVFVLSATDDARLEPSQGKSVHTWIDRREAQLQGASLERLAAALQSILGRPVIDETGITGSYDVAFAWEDDRIPSVTTALMYRFGLRLSPARRDVEVLIVDRVQRDAACCCWGRWAVSRAARRRAFGSESPTF